MSKKSSCPLWPLREERYVAVLARTHREPILQLPIGESKREFIHPGIVGTLFLGAEKDEAVAHYALGGLSNKVFASRYKLQLPDPKILKREIEAERRRLEQRVFLKKER